MAANVCQALFYRNRLSKIARFVDGEPAPFCRVVRKQLERNGGENRQKCFVRLGYVHNVFGKALYAGIAVSSYGDESARAGENLLNI